jgi:hypothetical protein
LPLSGSNAAVQFVGLAVVEEDAGALAVEDFQGRFLDDLEQGLQVRRGRELARDFEDSKEVAVLISRKLGHQGSPCGVGAASHGVYG